MDDDDNGDDGGDSELSTYRWAEAGLYILSAAGVCASGFVIVSFALFPPLRRRAFRLVLYLAISDCGAVATIFLNFHNKSFDKEACVFQGFSQQFFTIACVLWPLIIAFNLFSAVVLRGGGGGDNRKLGGARRCLAIFMGSPTATHMFVWGGALASAVIPLLSNSYGHAGTVTTHRLLFLLPVTTRIEYNTVPSVIAVVIIVNINHSLTSLVHQANGAG